MNTENNNTAVIYARVSSIGERQNTERQVSDLSALAIQKGLSIEKVYEEHVSGAKKNIDRPVLTECLDYCKSQHISILLVSELSRLGRNTFEVLSTVKDLMDFGQGFYVTDIQNQAESWADRMARIKMESGIVSVYDFDTDAAKKQYRYKIFDEYDESWLEFIIANLQETYRGEKYDIIEGGVANDRVIDTIEAYLAHLMPLDAALQELSKHRPNDQICICSQEVLDNHLHFVESYNIG